MSDVLVWLRAVVVAGGLAICELLGGWDVLLSVLLTLIVIDYVCGVVQAALDRQLNSTVGFRGIVKKVGYLILVVVSHMADHLLGLEQPIMRSGVVLFLGANESLSIIEHLAALGVPIPRFLLERLAKLRDATDGGGPA